VDLGSGGGFPGVVTAIFLSEIGGGWVDLVESNNKKAAFLRIALKETGARGAVHPVRIEKAPAILNTCDSVSARALAELDLLFDYIHPWATKNPDLKAYFNKGRDYESEVQKAHGRWQFDLVKHRSAIEADSVVLEISNLALRR
jgi:16S rRNA (guanine527-N7)-methyltransferase